MERDLDLYRDILLAVEEFSQPDGSPIRIQSLGDGEIWFPDTDNTDLPESIQNTDIHVLVRHIVLMTQANLVDSNARNPSQTNTNGRPTVVVIHGLTHEGHDFLENIREDTVWNKTKEEARSLALDVVKATAEGIIKGATGLQ